MRYMLDTNIVSSLMKQNTNVVNKVVSLPMGELCLSVISEGEIRYGLAKKPAAKKLHKVVQEFLKRVEVLPWDSSVADQYGKLRADLEAKGEALGPLDIQIAAHALSKGITLVTNDQAFKRVKQLKIEDWTR